MWIFIPRNNIKKLIIIYNIIIDKDEFVKGKKQREEGESHQQEVIDLNECLLPSGLQERNLTSVAQSIKTTKICKRFLETSVALHLVLKF